MKFTGIISEEYYVLEFLDIFVGMPDENLRVLHKAIILEIPGKILPEYLNIFQDEFEEIS